MRDDRKVQRDVMDELKWEPALRDEEIGVAVKDGVVTLSGQVSSYGNKYIAERTAQRVGGVKVVAEDLQVLLPGTVKRTDTDIGHSIVNAFRWDTRVPDTKVKAKVEDGWVHLEGEVDWQFQRDAAEWAVRFLAGVRGITNLIRIKPAKVMPYDVSQKITDALRRNAELDAERIVVEAHDGAVTLKGKVRSWAERRDAEQAAWSAPGVTQVEDLITVNL